MAVDLLGLSWMCGFQTSACQSFVIRCINLLAGVRQPRSSEVEGLRGFPMVQGQRLVKWVLPIRLLDIGLELVGTAVHGTMLLGFRFGLEW